MQFTDIMRRVVVFSCSTHFLAFPGPFAVMKAMRPFVRGHGRWKKQFAQIRGDEFTFQGMGGHTLRRDGSRATSNSIVKEFAVDNKVNRLKSNNVTHYSKTEVASGESCFDVITRYYEAKN